MSSAKAGLPEVRLTYQVSAAPAERTRGRRLLQTEVSQPSGGSLEVADRDQISLADRTNVGDPKGHESLRLAGREHELNVETVRRVDVDHGAKITATQALLRQVAIQNDDGERRGSPTKVRLASTPILTLERGSPVLQTSARKVRVLTRSKAHQVPPASVRLANDDV
jgi:hypothetical protein